MNRKIILNVIFGEDAFWCVLTPKHVKFQVRMSQVLKWGELRSEANKSISIDLNMFALKQLILYILSITC